MRLGAHMSIAGGVAKAFDHGERAGCESLQIFLKNNNQWLGKAISDEDRDAFRQRGRETGIAPVIAHNCYLINLCSTDDAIAEKSYNAMLDELQRGEFIGVAGVVLHPGAPKEMGEAEGLRRIVEASNRLIEATPKSKVRLLFEGTAGQGSALGWRFEQLAELMRGVKKKTRAGICLDTCHLLAAGYDMRTPKAYAETMSEFDKVVGVKHIHAFHLNDSKMPLGSRRDRHEHIGKGYVGLETFRSLLNDERFADTPGVLETHKGDDLAEDIENLKTLRSLIVKKKAAKRTR